MFEPAGPAMSRRYIPPHFNRHPKTYPEDLPRQAAISPANPVALHSGHPVSKSSRAEYTIAPCDHVKLGYAYSEVAK
jgi:hypothetical protein